MALSMDELIQDEILERIAAGESLRSICQDERMPARSTVARFIMIDADFQAKCARARELQADYFDERIQDTAESCIEGKVDPHAAKVAISAWEWMAAKRAPKKYGDQLEITGKIEHSRAQEIRDARVQRGMLPAGGDR
jgi:hypothetical protein